MEIRVSPVLSRIFADDAGMLEMISRLDPKDPLKVMEFTAKMTRFLMHGNSVNPEVIKSLKEQAGIEVTTELQLDGKKFLKLDLFEIGAKTEKEKITAVKRISNFKRSNVEKDVKNAYLFGDNIEDANNGYVPTSTQAVIRGLPNAF